MKPGTPVWRNRDYMLLWSGQTVSAVGSQFSGFVIPFLVLTLTRSPAQTGLIGAVEGVPYIVFSLVAGALVDRCDRKVVMIVCDSVRALNMLSVPVAIALGQLTLAQLYLVALVEGTLFVFFNIAETASLPRVVPPDQLPAAMAQSETTWGISALVGPAAAGALFGGVSRAVPFVVDALSYLVSSLSLTLMRTRFQAEHPTPPGAILAGIRTALLWLWNQPLLRFLALITAAGDFLFSSIGLIPMVIAKQQLHAGALAIGFIFTLAAVGGIIGSVVAAPMLRRIGFAAAVIGPQWLQAALFPLLVVVPTPIGLGLVRTLLSASTSVSNTARLGYQAAAIPDALQGRVNSLATLMSYGSLPIGIALTGLLLQGIGITATVLAITGCLVILAVVTTASSHVRHAVPFLEIART